MTDTTTKEPVWTRSQPQGGAGPNGEAAAKRAWVDDDGLTLVRTEKDELFALGAADGKKTFQFVLHSQFSDADTDEYVEPCSPSPQWAGGSRSYFISLDVDGVSRRLFIIRTYWGRRIVVDLAGGNVLAEDRLDAKNLAEAQKSEEAWAHEVLSKWAKRVEKDKYQFLYDPDWDQYEELRAAVLFAGLQGLKAELPLLRTLEECHGGNGVRPNLAGGLRARYDPLRQACQAALRRLGATPSAQPGVEIKSDSGDDVKTNVTLKDRVSRVDKVKEGMSLREVAECLGNPDFDNFDRSLVWEYDIDAEKPFTLRISFEANSKVERLEPPVWKKASKRDRGPNG
ncbi:MAG: hypothetical protein AAB074_17895 [Planctomycetota bacterium]